MRQLPFADPGTPDLRSPTRFLLWVGRHQVGTLLLGMTFGIVWMLAQALLPWVLGRAIDEGVGTGDTQALLAWAGALLGLGVVQAIAGTFRHRVAVSNWLQASFRMIQVVAHHAALTGPAVRSRLTMSSARCFATAISHAPGLSGMPRTFHTSSARQKASCTTSSASARL